MSFILHGTRTSGNCLIYLVAPIVIQCGATFSRMVPDSNSDYESNGVLKSNGELKMQ